MPRPIGDIPKSPTEAFVTVEISTRGIEFECDPAFVLTPEQTLDFAQLLVTAARRRIAEEHALVGEIKDPERLAALVPLPPDARPRKAG